MKSANFQWLTPILLAAPLTLWPGQARAQDVTGLVFLGLSILVAIILGSAAIKLVFFHQTLDRLPVAPVAILAGIEFLLWCVVFPASLLLEIRNQVWWQFVFPPGLVLLLMTLSIFLHARLLRTKRRNAFFLALPTALIMVTLTTVVWLATF